MDKKCIATLIAIPILIIGNALSAGSESTSKAWLSQINEYRTAAGLDPVGEDPKSSAGDLNHARYLVKRFELAMTDKVNAHDEARDTRWSTPSGAEAAPLSDVALRTGPDQPRDEAAQIREVIDDWMTDPFERMPILDPDLRTVGLGVYREKGVASIVLQVRTPPPPTGEVPVGTLAEYEKRWGAPTQSPKYPIMFPPSGYAVSRTSYTGAGSPNPLDSCAGYGSLTGLPITLELGPSGHTETVTDTSITNQSKPLQHCVFIASTYRGFEPQETLVGRQDLTAFGAIVLIPRKPLVSGESYTVSVVTNLKEYKWSFSVR